MKVIIIKADDTDEVLYQKILDLASHQNGKMEIITSATIPNISVPGLTINCEQKQVFRDNCKIRLTNHEYELLYLFASRAGQAISKELIFEVVWGSRSESTLKVVANTIFNLRQKIEPDRQQPQYIKTVFGGYTFSPDVNS